MLRRPKAPETDEEDRARLQQQAKKFEAFLEVTKGRPLPPSQLQAAVAQMKAEGKAAPTVTTTSCSVIGFFNGKEVLGGRVETDNILVEDGILLGSPHDDQQLITKNLSGIVSGNLQTVTATIGGVKHEGTGILVTGAKQAAKQDGKPQTAAEEQQTSLVLRK